jgi:formate C-acetyltransferase
MDAKGRRGVVTGNTPASGMAAVAPQAHAEEDLRSASRDAPRLSLVTPDYDPAIEGSGDPASKVTRQIETIEGPDGERIRQLLLAAPKYGNDDDYVDSLVVEGYDSYIDEIAKYKNTRWGRGPIGGVYYAGTSSISANVPQGAGTSATPDGRRAGEPLAEGCSPTHSMDINGPTSVLKSVSKLRTEKITGGVLLNQKVSPSMLSNPRDRDKLLLLLRTFFDELHGFHIQYNVVSRDTLLDAQAHPEKHRDLIVRVAGYSAFFNVLSRQTQDDIIARTEQVL